MRSASNSIRSRPYRLALAAGLLGAAVSACSQDSSRFSDDPFTNPFGSREDVASSTSQRPATIESQPLAGPPASSQPNYASTPRAVPSAAAPAYTQQAAYSPATTGSSAPRAGGAGWRADGGTAVTLQQGETVDGIARRYGIPASEILRANNLADASRVAPGARLVIPTYQAAGIAPSSQSSQLSRPAPAYSPAQTRAQVHVVNSGDTLFSLGRRYGTTHVAIAQANGLSSDASLRVGQRMNIPVNGTATAARTTPFSPPPQTADATAPAPTRTASLQPEPAQKAAAVTTAEPEETRSLGGSPQFRWPARGRVISGYGPKANGQHNDGINLAVPEGTEIKAAEDGVVAYAGNELKGYGNLVLLRHSDGWMTAYAHNSQLLVKRGDSVKRGQNVARAGQTGGVTSPQVHFEIRKGSTPVDPTKYLAAL